MPSKAHPVFDALKANTLRLIIRELGQVSMVKGKREDMIARLVEIERTGCTWRIFAWTIRPQGWVDCAACLQRWTSWERRRRMRI